MTELLPSGFFSVHNESIFSNSRVPARIKCGSPLLGLAKSICYGSAWASC